AGTERGGDALERPGLVAPAEEPEPSLTEADDGGELGVVGELADVADLEARREPVICGRISGQGDEVLRQVDAHDVEATAGKGERVAPRAAADVEHPLPRLEPERVDEERDLLLRALRERRYSTSIRRPVGLPEMPRNLVEPRTARSASRRRRVQSTQSEPTLLLLGEWLIAVEAVVCDAETAVGLTLEHLQILADISDRVAARWLHAERVRPDLDHQVTLLLESNRVQIEGLCP